jgi:imidazolonepropionase-like amidohydrolase
MRIIVHLAFAVSILITSAVFAQEDLPSQVHFVNVNVFNGADDKLHAVDVLVEGNLIKAIGKDIAVRADAVVIDGGGRTLMPGLIDSHSHFNMNANGGVRAMEAMRWDEIASRAAAQAQD